jgi:crotonobetainyl-CoA:carnitine CoA-transferase CaiB-like acyl-CoA transferase
MRAFGLDYESLKQIKPDLIMISLSGYGQYGAYMDYSAYGMSLEPSSGVSGMTGYEGGPPIRSGLSFTDPYSGFIGAGAVLAALHYKRQTGKGQYIDLSEHEAAIPLTGMALMDYQMNQRTAERIGNRSPLGAAPQGVYRAKGDDAWLALSIENDDDWSEFCHAIGHDEWTTDPRFVGVLDRHKNAGALDELITSWSSEQDKYEAFHLLQRAGVIAAPVLNGKDALLDPHFEARGQYDTIDQPHQGKRLVGRHLAAKFETFTADAAGPAPTLGQHNHEVLSGMLGMSDDEIAALEEEKVLATKPNIPYPPQLISAALKLPYDKYVELGILQAVEEDYKKTRGLE